MCIHCIHLHESSRAVLWIGPKSGGATEDFDNLELPGLIVQQLVERIGSRAAHAGAAMTGCLRKDQQTIVF